MKKRILSCFMALALCLTLLPATALAADAHTHPICGKTCSHTTTQHPDNTFETKLYSESGDYSWHTKKGMGSAEKLELDTTNNQWKLPAGNYYLDGDTNDIYKTERTIKITGNVTICLNGKEIQKTKGDATPVFEVPSGLTLTLTDCKPGGKVTCGTTSIDSGSGVYVGSSGTFNLYEGQITGNKGQEGENADRYGGGVYVSDGTFEMHNNASVTGNKAIGNGVTLNGAGVYVSGKSSKFEMNNSASVKDNTANQGGGVYVESGTFNMNDGTISGNKAKNEKASNDTNGGGVYVNKSGTFNMTDGTITKNTATNSDEKNTTYGGGVYVSGGTFTMNGGTSSVTGNTATNGGGVSVSSGTFNMNDGKISGNTGNGVFVHNNATFTVSKTPTVTRNTIT